MRALIDLAAARGPFIDQSQSLNLFLESPNIGKLSLDVPARVEVGPQDHLLPALPTGDAHRVGHAPRPPPSRCDAVACSLENPEHCEACE